MAGAVEAVRLHVARGDGLDDRDANGMTPLMIACGRNRVQICKILLEAGADPWVKNPLGETALDVAHAAGSIEVIDFLEALQVKSVGSEITQDDARSNRFAKRSGSLNSVDSDLLPLDDWLAESEQIPPEGDPCIRDEVAAAQAAISCHVPQNDFADWDDVEPHLPDRSSNVRDAEDAQAFEDLRLLFVRALREGSVPEDMVNKLASSFVGEADTEVSRALRLTIEELGTEYDERIEYVTPWEDFRVYVDPEESPDEEEIISAAIAFLDGLSSHRCDPIRFYQRDFARLPLLTAEQEIAIAKSMEQAISSACDYLAAWPEGLQYLIRSVAMVASGEKSIHWLKASEADARALVSTCDAEVPAEIRATGFDVGNDDLSDSVASEQIGDEEGLDVARRPALSGFAEAEEWEHLAAQARSLLASIGTERFASDKTVQTMDLARSFLLELLQEAAAADSVPSRKFNKSMITYLQARDAMVCGNLRLASHHARRAMFSAMDMADLTQEANLGLLRAADKFDWRRGFRFSTYATWWIRQQVLRAVADDSRLIRLPVHVHDKVQMAARVSRDLERKLGREPTNDEVAEQMHVSATKVGDWFRLDQEPISLEDIDPNEEDAISVAEHSLLPDPFDEVLAIENGVLIEGMLATLKVKEAQVIRMRFGVSGFNQMTLEEVGAELGFTRERARQIESKALEKLRRSKSDSAVASVRSHPRQVAVSGWHASAQQLLAGQVHRKPETNNAASADPLWHVLDWARREGLVVHDERNASGSVSVHIDSFDSYAKRLLRKELLRFGFRPGPGKRYWL